MPVKKKVDSDKLAWNGVEWGQIFSLDKSSCFGNIGAWQDP